MNGRRAIIGLTLLSALLFSAIAVQSSSAAPATNTTAFTCVKTDNGKSTFTDAHCDVDSAGKTGNFEHQLLTVGQTTEGETTNETTGGATVPMTLKGEPFGVKTHIICKTAKGTGTGGNTEPSGGVHSGSGQGTSEFSNCEVKEVAKCTKVKEPIIAKVGSGQGLEGLTGPKGEANAMGGELKAEAGKPFAEITLEGTCAIQGKPFPVAGSVVATSGPGTAETQTNKWTGATVVYTAAMTKETLTVGGKKAELVGTTTVRLKNGSPVVATTVT